MAVMMRALWSSCSSGRLKDNDDGGEDDEDGVGAIICQERFWFQKGRTWDVRTEGRKRAEK